MVVISIISILAAISVGAAFRVRYTMNIRIAKANAARFAQAIESYRALETFLPVQSIYSAPPTGFDPMNDADGDYENWDLIRQVNGIMGRDPLLKLASNELNENGSFKDKWGRPFRVIMWKANDSDAYYKYFTVYSSGPDTVWAQGAGDDINP